MVYGERKNYCMSFTTGGLLERETIILANILLQTNDLNRACQQIKDANLFQYRTTTAATRILSELKTRFQALDDDALKLISVGFPNEIQQISWFMVCKKYPFIFEFVHEVIKEKYFIGQLELTDYDFDTFFNKKMVQHQNLEKITDNSRYKLKQVLFKMLREVGLLDKQSIIQTVLPTKQVARFIEHKAPNYLGIFIN